MKKLIVGSLTVAMSLGLSVSALAETKPKSKATPAAAEAKPAEKAEKKANRPLPMYTRVDSIDTKAKTFTTKRKRDGAEIKHVVAATTEIKNGEAAAKFEDIKVGDYVSGTRNKKSDTEYEIVKITKFGEATPKKEKKEEKKEEKKP
jgi:hypothetical protein